MAPVPQTSCWERASRSGRSKQESSSVCGVESQSYRGLLDAAGIDSDLTSASLLQEAFPGLGGMIILVREEDSAAAQKIIAEQRQSAIDDDETAEIEIVSEEPPQKA